MNSRPLPSRPGPAPDRLPEMLRVDHAGELAAVHIYRGHRAVFEAVGETAAAEKMRALETEEAAHLVRFEALLTEHRVRPTLLAPIWRAASFGLGVGAALLGEKAVHACTEAVETVIGAHYERQAAELAGRRDELAAELSTFRDDELAHRDEAVRDGAREAPLYGLMSRIVRGGCRAAIKISERI